MLFDKIYSIRREREEIFSTDYYKGERKKK